MIKGKNYYITQLNSSKAYQFTSFYHYSGIGFKKAQLNLGVFRNNDNLLVGVLQWGVYEKEGIKLDRYVKEPINKEEYLELNRFCMADSEGKNAESQAISLGIKWIKKYRPDIKLLVSYAGRKEGNYGYIYQATNWEYLGYFISNGFWELDGQEKHQITVWYRYKKYGDTTKSFKEGICDLYNNVKQTWSKQFIYIQRLDSSLTPANEILPYPKPDNEYPICTRVEIYKDEPYKNSSSQEKEMPLFYYTKGEELFTRRTLNRHNSIGKNAIAIYLYNGELYETSNTITEAAAITNISFASISKALKNEKACRKYYFRYYDSLIEPVEQIEVPWLAEIEGIRFLKQTEIADYCNVSRQAVSQAFQRKSKIINGKEVVWNNI